MDENTKALIASNLTLALYTARTSQGDKGDKEFRLLSPGTPPGIDSVYGVYERFLAKLNSTKPAGAGSDEEKG